ncbi:cupin domain protein, partial [Vibrio parahaemolyticus VPTS-2010]
IDNTLLTGGDGAKIEAQSKVTFRNLTNQSVTALIFDLP